MALTLHWAGENEIDRVAQTRLLCYGSAEKEAELFKQRSLADRRPGEFLLAELDGQAVGTATSLNMQMWVRGGKIPCQGVAWVGTIKTHRRGGRGIASSIMHEILRKARDNDQVVSALMPFRTSFYEHFGYGIVERRNEWTVPLSILPHGDCDGMRFYRGDDLPAVKSCRQKMDEAGQCAIERSPQGWEKFVPQWENGLTVVDGSRGWMYLEQIKQDGKTIVRVEDAAWDSHESLLRQLHFLANLRDQYSAAVLTLPADVPLNWILKESQLPHRPVEHDAAKVRPMTRMQVRVLDHAKFLAALKLPPNMTGQATIAVKETEGNVSMFRVELAGGRIAVKSASGNPDIEFPDKVWAAIACGELSATAASRMQLIKTNNPSVLPTLDVLGIGPAPFCNEYF